MRTWAPRVVVIVLALAAVAVLLRVYEFGQQRFFTVDEWQYGHATWLISEGKLPYRDFYEHHFPLSYVLHAPLLDDDGSFGERALRLRGITSGYLVALALVLAGAGFAATRNSYVALLSVSLALGFGFGLMSAVDYRADNFAACMLLAALALAEANRRWRRRSVAAVWGLLAAMAIGTTQKMLLLAGGSFAVLWLLDRWNARRDPASEPLLRFPGSAALAALAVGAALLAAGAWLGLLGSGFEATIVNGFEHERLYPESSSSFREYAEPFLAYTAFTTVPLLALASLFLASREGRFWRVPVVMAVLAGLLQTAQYPYNYVLLGMLLMIAAVRGFAWLVERPRPPLHPVVYLVPLLVLPNQLGFVAHASDNAYQLAMLDKIEALTKPGDAVIDGAGGALFRPHGSYYWVHGDAHRLMFKDYFENELVDDYRASRALLWIDDFRQRKLPPPVRRYFESHYVQVDGRLFGLGFESEPTGDEAREFEFEVIRPGVYQVLRVGVGEKVGSLPSIDGRRLDPTGHRLEVGRHRLRVPPHSPAYAVSLLPARAFREKVNAGRAYTRAFEYEWRRPAATWPEPAGER